MQYKIEPYQWQKKAIEMSGTHTDLALLAEMGTGKTGALVNILRSRFYEYGYPLRTLIISPQVTLFNWRDEIEKHSNITRDKVLVLYRQGSAGKLKQMERDLEHSYIVVINYEALLSDKVYKALFNWKPEILVCDESHYVKNHKAKRSKKVAHMADRARHRYILSGTPILKDIADVFMQYRILDGGDTFGKDHRTFMGKYMMDENASWKGSHSYFPKWVPRESMFPELQDKIYSKAIRVLKSECLDLPPLVKEVYKVQLSTKQRKYYDQMKRDFLTFVQEKQKEGVVVAQLAVTKALRLQQIVTGFVQTEEGDLIEISDNPRLDAVKELLQALHVEHKVILWCSFKHNYKQLGRLCEDLKIGHAFLTGEMNLKEKQDAMERFNKQEDCRVIIANRRAGGIGVNLVSASYSIVYSRNFSLGDELQSEARNHRGGSQIHSRIVKIDLCAIDTIDEQVVEALHNKQEISDRIIDLVKEEK
jgi:SNF2 family DNA or RNA helicase